MSNDLTEQALNAFREAIRAERNWSHPKLPGSAEDAWDAVLDARRAIRAIGYRLDKIRAAVEGYDTGIYQDKLQAFDAIRAIIEGGQE